jgi:hypothetical protein
MHWAWQVGIGKPAPAHVPQPISALSSRIGTLARLSALVFLFIGTLISVYRYPYSVCRSPYFCSSAPLFPFIGTLISVYRYPYLRFSAAALSDALLHERRGRGDDRRRDRRGVALADGQREGVLGAHRRHLCARTRTTLHPTSAPGPEPTSAPGLVRPARGTAQGRCDLRGVRHRAAATCTGYGTGPLRPARGTAQGRCDLRGVRHRAAATCTGYGLETKIGSIMQKPFG